jgi:hypothetical protein
LEGWKFNGALTGMCWGTIRRGRTTAERLLGGSILAVGHVFETFIGTFSMESCAGKLVDGYHIAIRATSRSPLDNAKAIKELWAEEAGRSDGN